MVIATPCQDAPLLERPTVFTNAVMVIVSRGGGIERDGILHEPIVSLASDYEGCDCKDNDKAHDTYESEYNA